MTKKDLIYEVNECMDEGASMAGSYDPSHMDETIALRQELRKLVVRLVRESKIKIPRKVEKAFAVYQQALDDSATTDE